MSNTESHRPGDSARQCYDVLTERRRNTKQALHQQVTELRDYCQMLLARSPMAPGICPSHVAELQRRADAIVEQGAYLVAVNSHRRDLRDLLEHQFGGV
jgi:hypothetical protein